MVTVVVFEFCVMRCQPLRRALVANEEKCTHSRIFRVNVHVFWLGLAIRF
ncbi:acetyltransferase [Vibrio parahaemolyticus]|nr:acetyltransferase [Vibrio parahaemolyticus]